MGIITAIVVYFVIWWLVLLDGIAMETPQPSRQRACDKPRPNRDRLKLVVTTAVSAILFALFYWVQASDLITLRPA